jgi:transposase
MVRRADSKLVALRAQRALHPHPERVSDPLFQDDTAFFDARDVVQVKYEMLRCVQRDQRPVAAAARTFGLSRPIFYQAQKAFERGGLPALQRARPGPRRRHKLTPKVLAFLRRVRAEQPGVGARRLAREVQARFDLRVHPRSIERALRERGKGGRSTT